MPGFSLPCPYRPRDRSGISDAGPTTSSPARARPSRPRKKPAATARKTQRKKELHFDDFADSYLSTAVWADRPEGCYADDVWPACIPRILEDCHRFQRENHRLLESAYDQIRVDDGERRLYEVTDYDGRESRRRRRDASMLVLALANARASKLGRGWSGEKALRFHGRHLERS